jgi:hypothetical protein
MKCKTGGLSIVHNRRNIAGEDKMNRLKINPAGGVYLHKTENGISHVIGVDFNSLYPTAFSSTKLDYLDKPIKLPAYYRNTITNKDQIRKFISKRSDELVFFVSVVGHCPITEETINFPPIIRNIDLTTDRETIGDYTYEYMKEHNLKTDKRERKLTQLLDTRGDFMVFYSAYLYFLMDTCGFVIDDVERLHVFTAHESFNEFATQTMKRRQETILAGDKVRDMFNKISLNGSYGYDIMDESNYRKVKIMNKHKTNLAMLTPNYRSAEKIGHDAYLVESVPKTFECKTCAHEGIATLDIAKMLYLNFIYNFMYKCLDMDKVHFCEGDTDSGYFAIAGNGNGGFQDVIKDEKFYMANIGKYLTSDFYGVKKEFEKDENENLTQKGKLDKMCFEKRFGALSIEKEATNMIALASKMYCI